MKSFYIVQDPRTSVIQFLCACDECNSLTSQAFVLKDELDEELGDYANIALCGTCLAIEDELYEHNRHGGLDEDDDYVDDVVECEFECCGSITYSLSHDGYCSACREYETNDESGDECIPVVA